MEEQSSDIISQTSRELKCVSGELLSGYTKRSKGHITLAVPTQ